MTTLSGILLASFASAEICSEKKTLSKNWSIEEISYSSTATPLVQKTDNELLEPLILIFRKENELKSCSIVQTGNTIDKIVVNDSLELAIVGVQIDSATFDIYVINLKTNKINKVDQTPIEEEKTKMSVNWNEKMNISPCQLNKIELQDTNAIGITTKATLKISFNIDLTQPWPKEGDSFKMTILKSEIVKE